MKDKKTLTLSVLIIVGITAMTLISSCNNETGTCNVKTESVETVVPTETTVTEKVTIIVEKIETEAVEEVSAPVEVPVEEAPVEEVPTEEVPEENSDDLN